MLDFVWLALAVAAISTTIAKAKIFSPLRVWIKSKSSWFGDLISCAYCTSHWVALVVILWEYPGRMLSVGEVVVSIFAVIAMSAVVIGTITNLLSFEPDPPVAYAYDLETHDEEREPMRLGEP